MHQKSIWTLKFQRQKKSLTGMIHINAIMYTLLSYGHILMMLPLKYRHSTMDVLIQNVTNEQIERKMTHCLLKIRIGDKMYEKDEESQMRTRKKTILVNYFDFIH